MDLRHEMNITPLKARKRGGGLWESDDGHFLIGRDLSNRWYVVGTEQASISERRIAADQQSSSTRKIACVLLASSLRQSRNA